LPDIAVGGIPPPIGPTFRLRPTRRKIEGVGEATATNREADGRQASDEGERPLCQCHGDPSRWHNDPRRAAGGSWRCSIKRRVADARYEASDKRRAARRRYKASQKGRAAQERYRMSDKGRATERRRILRAAVRRREARMAEIDALLKRRR
jgi:hypothetical protein